MPAAVLSISLGPLGPVEESDAASDDDGRGVVDAALLPWECPGREYGFAMIMMAKRLNAVVMASSSAHPLHAVTVYVPRPSRVNKKWCQT